MFCASTAGSNTEVSTVTLAPCFSRPLLTEFAQAAQNGFWLVQMMTPTFLPDSGPALLRAHCAGGEDGCGYDERREQNPTRCLARHAVTSFRFETIDERSRSGWCVVAWYEVGQGGDGAS